MTYPYWNEVHAGTQASDIGVYTPPKPFLPVTNADLLSARIQYAFTWNGNDSLRLDVPWRTVASLGAGNDRYDDLTPWGSHPGLDSLTLRATYSEIYGDQGNDTIYGGFGRDVLKGGPGNDQLFGGDNNDALWGNGHSLAGVLSVPTRLFASDSHVLGGPFLTEHPSLSLQADWRLGSNTLNGGNGDDFLAGGGQYDVYLTGPGSDVVAPDGIAWNPWLYDPTPDLAVDFDVATDRISFFTNLALPWVKPTQFATDFDAFIELTQNGDDVDVGYDPDGDPTTGGFKVALTLQNVSVSDLSMSNFPGFERNEVYSIDALQASFGSAFDDSYVITGTYLEDFPIYASSGDDDISFELSMPPTQGLPIDGGLGNDSITGTGGDDLLRGGPGNDTLGGLEGDDILIGGNGGAGMLFGSLEQLPLPPGSDRIDGGAGSDVLHNDGGWSTLTGGAGSDAFIVVTPAYLRGHSSTVITDFNASTGTDPDYLILTGLHAPAAALSFSVDADANATHLLIDPDGSAGSETPEVVVTLENLQIDALDDLNIVGLGNGPTTIGRLHVLIGTRGDDDLIASPDGLTTYLHAGNDTLDGSSTTDGIEVYLCVGNDSAIGGVGDDFLDGGSGSDTLRGGAGHDVLIGDGQDPSLDPLDPSAPMPVNGGADVLDGQDGDDLLIPGVGVDTITGGAGTDSTLFEGRGTLGDVFTDFETGFFGDRIMLAGIFELDSGMTAASDYVSVQQDGPDTRLFGDFDGFGFGDDSLELLAILQGVNAGDVFINVQIFIGDPFIPNHAPTSSDGAGSTSVNTPLFGALPPAVDIDSDRVTYSLALAPTDGTALVAPNGVIVYTPDTDFAGTDMFEFTVSDQKGGQNTYTASVNVIQPNRAPISMDADLAATEDVALAGDLPSATDPDGDPVGYTLHTQAGHGIAEIEPDGSFTYTPYPDFFGTDLFKFTVADGLGGANTYDANVTVAGVVDTISGGAGPDTLTDDTDGPAELSGLAGDDTMTGGTGDDTIDGGEGTDTAVWTRDASNYSLSFSGEQLIVEDATGTDGTDLIASTENLQFADRNVIVESRAHGSYADIPEALWHFFIVAFNAAPGVEYMDQLAEAHRYFRTLPGTANPVKTIVDIFTTKHQFTDVYPLSLTFQALAEELVAQIVKGSASEAAKLEATADIKAALDFGWSRGDVIYTVFGNLANKPFDDPTWGGTARQFANEITVAKYFTEVLNQSTTDLETLRDVLHPVGPDTDVSTPDVVATLIGVALMEG